MRMPVKVFGGRWERIGQLEQGGQGVIYLVKDLRDPQGGTAALKRLKNIQRLDRFSKEIRALKGLDAPDIVRILDENPEPPEPYLVMEYCSHGNLEKRALQQWKRKPLESISRILCIFERICAAVGKAHKAGITHRDLKPANILFRDDSDSPVVADFGLCYLDDDDSRLTICEEAVGPRWYMAPELESGRAKNVNPRSDVYSLGKLLYWMLSPGNVFSREVHREQEWNLIGLLNEPALEHVNVLLDRMIVVDPAKRYSDASEVAVAGAETNRLIKGGFRVISTKIQQRCTYCGIGYYKPVPDPYNFGIQTNYAGAKWRIVACNHCGHVQLFRLDLAEDSNVWDRDTD